MVKLPVGAIQTAPNLDGFEFQQFVKQWKLKSRPVQAK